MALHYGPFRQCDNSSTVLSNPLFPMACTMPQHAFSLWVGSELNPAVSAVQIAQTERAIKNLVFNGHRLDPSVRILGAAISNLVQYQQTQLSVFVNGKPVRDHVTTMGAFQSYSWSSKLTITEDDEIPLIPPPPAIIHPCN